MEITSAASIDAASCAARRRSPSPCRRREASPPPRPPSPTGVTAAAAATPSRASRSASSSTRCASSPLESSSAALAEIGYGDRRDVGFARSTAAKFPRARCAAPGSARRRATRQSRSRSMRPRGASRSPMPVTVGQRYIVCPASPIVFPPSRDISTSRLRDGRGVARVTRSTSTRPGAIARRSGLRFGDDNDFWEFAALTDDMPLTATTCRSPRPTRTSRTSRSTSLDLVRPPRPCPAPRRLRRPHPPVPREGHARRRPRPLVGRRRDRRDRLRADLRGRRRSEPLPHEYIVERDDAGAGAPSTAAAGYSYLRRLRF